MQSMLKSASKYGSTGASYHWLWNTIAIFTLIMLVNLSSSKVIFAQNSSCGEPERSQGVEGQADPNLNRTFKLDQCVIRNFDYGGQPKKVVVYYTLTNGIASDHLLAVDSDGNGTADLTPNQIADRVALWTEIAWRTYRDYGMPDPRSLTTFRVHLFDSRPGLLGWCCTPESYEIDAPAVRAGLTFGGDPRNAEYITYHEMWHAMESSAPLGGWATEGGAAFMSDHVTLPVDTDDDGDYLGRVSEYMGGAHITSITAQEYSAAPWWTYFTEQFSTINAEPSRGSDIMKEYVLHPAATAFERINTIIRSHDTSRRLESVWMDFAVTNYAKDLTGNVPARYRYQDESQPNAPQYRTVELTSEVSISPGNGAGPQQSDVQAWASKYYKFNIAANVPIINLEFRQDSNQRLGYVLMKIRNGDLVETTYSLTRDFVQSFANSNYTSIVVAVVSFESNANFRYTINATEPVLNIIDPLESRKAQAGAPDAPGKILIEVEVLNPAGGGTPIQGISTDVAAPPFAVAIGAKIVPAADYISIAYIQGQYWMLLRAPTQAAVGDYALTVTYGTLNDVELRAVHYEATKNADNVLVIDRSGSMAENGGGKMVAAKDAARLYVDSWRNGDQVAVVSFNEDATVNLSLNDWQLARGAALTAINGLTPGGDTSIGDGAIAGMNELATKGIAGSHDWAMIVLSDGIENRMEFIPTFLASYAARVNATPPMQVPKVHTIALGADADRARLENLAAQTGGNYYFASLPVAASADSSNPDAIHSDYLSNDLAEIYRVASEQVAHNQQVYLNTHILSFDDTPITHTITLEGAVNEATFVLKWNDDGLGSTVTLRQPDGTDVGPPTTTDALHYIWRIPAPQPGNWTMAVDFELNCDPCAEEVLVEASVLSDLSFDVFLDVPVDKRVVGRFMPIYSSLSDSLVIDNATVVATISTPSGGIYSVPLLDDGLHNDGIANDGFYGGIFYQTWDFGGYHVVVDASGTSPRTGAFVRRLRTDFNMLEFRVWDPSLYPNADPNHKLNPLDEFDPNWDLVDRDRDTLIDWFELQYGLDPELDSSNAGDDPDYDGLSNYDEFMQGADPTTSDTDKGGENDASETMRGSNPLDPADDAIPCPFSLFATQSVHDHDNPDEPIHVDANVLYYDVNVDHTSINIWRAKNDEARGFYDAAMPATGIYSDTNVTVGDTYQYWISAIDLEGHGSCILGPATMTTRADALPPEGLVQINSGAQSTTNANVTLALEAIADTTEMQVRNSPASFDPAAGWVPYVTTLPWQLVSEGGFGQVFVWYRDAAGNVSQPAFDAILLDAPPDITAPVGTVSINNGAASTVGLDVTLTLAAAGEATEMQVRDDLGDFDGAQGWIAYATTLPWHLVQVGERGRVYLWYRDAAGNVSKPATDDIGIGTGSGSEDGLYLPKVERQ